MHILKIVFILLLLFSLIGFAEAGQTYNVVSTGSQDDQNTINDVTQEAYNAGGGEVYLTGTFNVTDSVLVGSNTILTSTTGATIRVSDLSKQFFVDGVGIIDQIDAAPCNVNISNIKIDGNMYRLPTNYANSGPGVHNAHRAIDLRGSTDAFMQNISINKVTVVNTYSDGIHVVFAEGVDISGNTLINNQHDGVNAVNILNGKIQDNYVEAITSDGIRADNSPGCTISDNYITTFTGDSNGAYKHGENGIQVGDQGFSKGLGSIKPDKTENVSIFGNTIRNIGLEAIKLYTDAKNVIIGDNEIINDEKTDDVVITGQLVDIDQETTEPVVSENITESNTETEDVITVSGNDDAAINRALDKAAMNPGSTVLLPSGTYSVTRKIIVHKDTTIRGEVSKSGELLSKIELVKDSTLPQQEAVFEMEEGAKFLYLDYDGNSKYQKNVPWNTPISQMGQAYHNVICTYYADNIEIAYCNFDNSLGDILRIRSGVDVQIHDNKLSRAGHEAVFLIQCENAEVYDNYIWIRDNCGVRLIGGVGIRAYSNYIYYLKYDPEDGSKINAAHAFQIQNDGGVMRDIEITGNTMVDIPVSAFWIVGKSGNDEDVIIHDNVILNSGNGDGWGKAGAIISGFTNVIFENNVFDTTQKNVIEFRAYAEEWGTAAFATIRNNIFVDSTGAGISNQISAQTGSSSENCYYNTEEAHANGFSSTGDYFTNPRTSPTLCNIKWDGTQWVIPGIVPKALPESEHVYKDVDPVTDEEIDEFDNIFKLLGVEDTEFVDTGRTSQTADNVKVEVEETTNGRITGGVKLYFKDVVNRNGVSYISGEDDILAKYVAIRTPIDGWYNGGTSKFDKEITTEIKDGIAYANLTITMEWYTFTKNKITGGNKKKEHTDVAVFRDSRPAYDIWPELNNTTAIASEYRGQVKNYTLVSGPTDVQKLVYNYDGTVTTHYYLLGQRYTDNETGIKYTNLTDCNYWEGDLPHYGESLFINGSFDPDKLTVEAYSPYESMPLKIDHTIEEQSESAFSDGVLEFIIKSLLYLFGIDRLIRIVKN